MTDQQIESNPNRIVYFDMDGVLANFEGHFQELSHLNIDSVSDEELWKIIEAHGKRKFFSELPWMPGGKQMWDFAIQNFLQVKILSALGKSDAKDHQASAGKLLWLNKNIPSIRESDIHLVPNKHVKKHYCKSGDILIDDTQIVITEWIHKGGIGILHKTSIDTIKRLEKYV